MEKFIDKKTNKVILEIDDEGNETLDEDYFKKIVKEKVKLEDEVRRLEAELTKAREARDV